jgi:hypothetical protein
MRFAFDKDWRSGTAKIKPVRLLSIPHADRHREIPFEVQALLGEKGARNILKFFADTRIVIGADSLKIVDFDHQRFPTIWPWKLYMRFAQSSIAATKPVSGRRASG